MILPVVHRATILRPRASALVVLLIHPLLPQFSLGSFFVLLFLRSLAKPVITACLLILILSLIAAFLLLLLLFDGSLPLHSLRQVGTAPFSYWRTDKLPRRDGRQALPRSRTYDRTRCREKPGQVCTTFQHLDLHRLKDDLWPMVNLEFIQ
jgi:hypothetical protein